MGGSLSGSERLVLTAGGLLDQPPGYELLDLDGTLIADRRTYSKIVVGSPDCTGFFVSKADQGVFTLVELAMKAIVTNAEDITSAVM